jgi:hypothetical protein
MPPVLENGTLWVYDDTTLNRLSCTDGRIIAGYECPITLTDTTDSLITFKHRTPLSVFADGGDLYVPFRIWTSKKVIKKTRNQTDGPMPASGIFGPLSWAGPVFGDTTSKRTAVVCYRRRAPVWEKEVSGNMNGNLLFDDTVVGIGLAQKVVLFDKATGSIVSTFRLPWDDFEAPLQIRIDSSAVTAISEWHIARWCRISGDMIYHHRFVPLSDMITTQKRIFDERAGAVMLDFLRGSAKNTPENLAHLDAARFSMSYATRPPSQSLASATTKMASNYSRQGYHNHAANAYSLAASYKQADMHRQASKARTDATVAAVNAAGAAVTGSFQAFAAISDMRARAIIPRNLAVHTMVYPYIDYEISLLRAFDTRTHAVRLVGVPSKAGRGTALEIVELSTGKLTKIPLSSYIQPGEAYALFERLRSKIGNAEGFRSGYWKEALSLDQNYRVAIDWQRRLVVHYDASVDGIRAIRF